MPAHDKNDSLPLNLETVISQYPLSLALLPPTATAQTFSIGRVCDEFGQETVIAYLEEVLVGREGPELRDILVFTADLVRALESGNKSSTAEARQRTADQLVRLYKAYALRFSQASAAEDLWAIHALSANFESLPDAVLLYFGRASFETVVQILPSALPQALAALRVLQERDFYCWTREAITHALSALSKAPRSASAKLLRFALSVMAAQRLPELDAEVANQLRDILAELGCIAPEYKSNDFEDLLPALSSIWTPALISELREARNIRGKVDSAVLWEVSDQVLFRGLSAPVDASGEGWVLGSEPERKVLLHLATSQDLR
jgi:hypothetical protein